MGSPRGLSPCCEARRIARNASIVDGDRRCDTAPRGRRGTKKHKNADIFAVLVRSAFSRDRGLDAVRSVGANTTCREHPPSEVFAGQVPRRARTGPVFSRDGVVVVVVFELRQ